jgi:hypothetical protein
MPGTGGGFGAESRSNVQGQVETQTLTEKDVLPGVVNKSEASKGADAILRKAWYVSGDNNSAIIPSTQIVERGNVNKPSDLLEFNGDGDITDANFVPVEKPMPPTAAELKSLDTGVPSVNVDWNDIRGAAINAMGNMAKIPVRQVKGFGNNALNGAVNYIGRRRLNQQKGVQIPVAVGQNAQNTIVAPNNILRPNFQANNNPNNLPLPGAGPNFNVLNKKWVVGQPQPAVMMPYLLPQAYMMPQPGGGQDTDQIRPQDLVGMTKEGFFGVKFAEGMKQKLAEMGVDDPNLVEDYMRIAKGANAEVNAKRTKYGLAKIFTGAKMAAFVGLGFMGGGLPLAAAALIPAFLVLMKDKGKIAKLGGAYSAQKIQYAAQLIGMLKPVNVNRATVNNNLFAPPGPNLVQQLNAA